MYPDFKETRSSSRTGNHKEHQRMTGLSLLLWFCSLTCSTTLADVFSKQLVREDISDRDILRNYQSHDGNLASVKHFPNDLLGYITPWNSVGYDNAKIFRSKFSLISPVWLQIRRLGPSQYSITGTHDIDKGWIEEVRWGKTTDQNSATKAGPRIVPRVLVEFGSNEDWQALLSSQTEMMSFVSTIVSICKEHSFDGIVLEAPPMALPYMTAHISSLAKSLHEESEKRLILVYPPLVNVESLVVEGLRKLMHEVDFVSLMTYDYTPMSQPGPNAPISWIEQNIKILCPDHDLCRSKILTGLNFYGREYSKRGPQNQYQGKATTYKDVVQTLNESDENVEWDWHEEYEEHVRQTQADDGTEVQLWYPSLMSIDQRLDLAKELGTGVAVWELGQGMDYFYDLF